MDPTWELPDEFDPIMGLDPINDPVFWMPPNSYVKFPGTNHVGTVDEWLLWEMNQAYAKYDSGDTNGGGMSLLSERKNTRAYGLNSSDPSVQHEISRETFGGHHWAKTSLVCLSVASTGR